MWEGAGQSPSEMYNPGFCLAGMRKKTVKRQIGWFAAGTELRNMLIEFGTGTKAILRS